MPPFPTDRRSTLLIIRAFLDFLHQEVEEGRSRLTKDHPPTNTDSFDELVDELLHQAKEEQDGLAIFNLTETDDEVLIEIYDTLKKLAPIEDSDRGKPSLN